MTGKETEPTFIEKHKNVIFKTLDVSTLAFAGFTVYTSILGGFPAILPGIGAGASGFLRFALEKQLQKKNPPPAA